MKCLLKKTMVLLALFIIFGKGFILAEEIKPLASLKISLATPAAFSLDTNDSKRDLTVILTNQLEDYLICEGPCEIILEAQLLQDGNERIKSFVLIGTKLKMGPNKTFQTNIQMGDFLESLFWDEDKSQTIRIQARISLSSERQKRIIESNSLEIEG